MKQRHRLAETMARRALASLSSIADQDQLLHELGLVEEALKTKDEIRQLLTHPGIDLVERTGWVERAFSPVLSAGACHLIQELLAKRALDLLTEIKSRIESLRERVGVARAVVLKSVSPLHAEERKKLCERLEHAWGMHVNLEEKTDACGGGFRLETKDWYFDATIRGRTERLAKILTA